MTHEPQSSATKDSNHGTKPSSASTTKRRNAVFLGLSLGNFLVLLDTSILNVALPDVQHTLSASDAQLPWAAVSYTITFAGLLLASGALSDRFGAKRVYCASLFGFAAASLFCAAAPNMNTLIGGRVLLGVAGAAMVPSSLALLGALYSDPGARARAIGTWAALTSSGLLLGPVLGGLLVTAGGWRLIFLVNPPIALIAVLLAMKGLTNARPDSIRPLDVPGIVLSVIALTTVTYGLISGGTVGWDRPAPWIALVISTIAVVVLLIVEQRVEHPVLPSALLRRSELSSSIIAAAAATLVFYGILYSLTLWLQQQQELSALETGLSFIPMTLPMCILPIFTGKLVARFQARTVILGGLVCDIFAGAFLIGVATSGSALVWITAAEIALVLGSTTVIPAATALVSIRATPDIVGAAQGALNAGRQAGSALGVAILGPMSSLPAIGCVLTLIAVVTLALVFLFDNTANRAFEAA